MRAKSRQNRTWQYQHLKKAAGGALAGNIQEPESISNLAEHLHIVALQHCLPRTP
jgi:hypothetical protein